MSDTGNKILVHLPVFSDVTPESQWERLRVQGLVEQPLELDQESLLALAQQGIAEDFHCVEGWVVPDQQWEGCRCPRSWAWPNPFQRPST